MNGTRKRYINVTNKINKWMTRFDSKGILNVDSKDASCQKVSMDLQWLIIIFDSPKNFFKRFFKTIGPKWLYNITNYTWRHTIMQNITAFCQMVLVVVFSRCYCRKTLYNSRKNGWFKITVQYDYKKKNIHGKQSYKVWKLSVKQSQRSCV